ncbi:MAG: hypothetical protein JJU02_11850 [Cryomorphaceae bacterium]|nr:hypothetical protein [Cryomorphaceae bacterium]
MNIKFVEDLIKGASYPSITVTLKTHRTAPGVTQDPINLKNLRNELKSRLENEMDKRDAQMWLKRFDTFIDLIDHQNNLDGLGIFLGEKVGMVKRFPFDLPNRVVVDKNFATRDLLVGMSKSLRYYVLTLSKETADLFEANEDRFADTTEIEGFPMENPRIHANSLEKSFSDTEDRYTEEFFREVDEKLAEVMKQEPLPLVIIGVRRIRDYFLKKTAHQQHLIAQLDGSRDAGNASTWLNDIWKEVGKQLQSSKKERLEGMKNNVSPDLVSSYITDIYKLAREGRVKNLIVDKSYHQAARINNGNLEVLNKPENADDYDDVIDEVAEQTILNGGQVDFFDNKNVAFDQPIFAILRY